MKVQLLTLLPPLEQAPDQMASRPLETRSVIGGSGGNDAEPLLPVATLMPVGVETMRSPLRPDGRHGQRDVRGGGGGGAAAVTVTVAVRVTPS